MSHEIATDAFPPVATKLIGAVGSVYGVPVTASDAVLDPIVLTARTLTEYEVPLFRPLTEIGDAVTAGLGVIQFEPPSSEYS